MRKADIKTVLAIQADAAQRPCLPMRTFLTATNCPQFQSWVVEHVFHIQAKPCPGQVATAVLQRDVAGYVVMRTGTAANRRHKAAKSLKYAHILELTVGTLHVRSGLGRLLLEAVQATTAPHTSLTIDVAEDNPAGRAFLVACGFTYLQQRGDLQRMVWHRRGNV